MNDWSNVTLENLGGGVVIERFQDALKSVIENIMDVDTVSTKEREIKIAIKFKPEQDREKVIYTLSVDTKLSPPRSIGSVMYVGKKANDFIAYEQEIIQGELFEQKEQKLKIINEGTND